MNSDLISISTRNEFREVLSRLFVLREIDSIFSGAGLVHNSEFTSPFSGERRSLVEKYYANIVFSKVSDIQKLLLAYEEIIFTLEQAAFTNPDVKPVVNNLAKRMERDGYTYENGRFVSDKLRLAGIEAPALVSLTQASITEHVEKARSKIQDGDFAGAITNSYTLVEEFIKELLRQTSTPFEQNEGDIRELYKLVAVPLNLNPKGENIGSHLKQILQGFKNQISGLFEVANKAGDRHARIYNPAQHHAKLVVNAAFCLCEFLLDSYEYQRLRQAKVGSEATSKSALMFSISTV